MFKRNDDFSEVNSVIGDNSYFQGTFSLKGALRVSGCYEGETLVVENLFVSPNGKIKSNIKGNALVIEGTIIGNIEASSRVMLMPTSRILGEVRTPELIIQNGAILEGLCIITPKTAGNPKEDILSFYESETSKFRN